MKDPKKFVKETLAKRAPKGVDPKKHERCVRDVKQEGYNVGSAHAICTASMKKAKDVCIPKDEFVREHKRLIQVLDNPSSKTSKEEARKQEKELKERSEKSDYATEEVGCGTGLAGKICRHNRKKLNRFVAIRKANVNKSLDFKDTLVSVDSKDQLLAEVTTSPALVSYIKKNLEVLKSGPGSTAKIPFPTGILTMTQREPGIYHGAFQDRYGQIVEKFDSETVEMITKTLQIKSLVAEPGASDVSADGVVPKPPDASDIAYSAHNRIDDLQKQIVDNARSAKGIRIKYGDFELEIKKSLRDFVTDYKASRSVDKDLVRKALSSWRKKYSEHMPLPNDHAAAKELTENWSIHQESFFQFVDALSRGEDEQS